MFALYRYGLAEYYRNFRWALNQAWYWSTTGLCIALVLVIGALVVGGLRFYCTCIHREHSFERWPETDYSPAMAECTLCGKEE